MPIEFHDRRTGKILLLHSPEEHAAGEYNPELWDNQMEASRCQTCGERTQYNMDGEWHHSKTWHDDDHKASPTGEYKMYDRAVRVATGVE